MATENHSGGSRGPSDTAGPGVAYPLLPLSTALHYFVKLLCSKIVNYLVCLHYKRFMTMNNYTIKSFVVLIRTF